MRAVQRCTGCSKYTEAVVIPRELRIIGATTIDEYRKHFEKDAALERRFQPVVVEEPDVLQAEEILMGLKGRYEAHHGIVISEEAVKAAVRLSQRYINDRNLPDKAIDLIDEAASAKTLNNFIRPTELRNLQEQAEVCKEELEALLIRNPMKKLSRKRQNMRNWSRNRKNSAKNGKMPTKTNSWY